MLLITKDIISYHQSSYYILAKILNSLEILQNSLSRSGIFKSHQMLPFLSKMHQNHQRLGLRPRPRWGSLQRSPRPPSCRWGRGRERAGKGRKKRWRGEGRGGEGRTPWLESWIRPCCLPCTSDCWLDLAFSAWSSCCFKMWFNSSRRLFSLSRLWYIQVHIHTKAWEWGSRK